MARMDRFNFGTAVFQRNSLNLEPLNLDVMDQRYGIQPFSSGLFVQDFRKISMRYPPYFAMLLNYQKQVLDTLISELFKACSIPETIRVDSDRIVRNREVPFEADFVEAQILLGQQPASVVLGSKIPLVSLKNYLRALPEAREDQPRWIFVFRQESSLSDPRPRKLIHPFPEGTGRKQDHVWILDAPLWKVTDRPDSFLERFLFDYTRYNPDRMLDPLRREAARYFKNEEGRWQLSEAVRRSSHDSASAQYERVEQLALQHLIQAFRQRHLGLNSFLSTIERKDPYLGNHLREKSRRMRSLEDLESLYPSQWIRPNEAFRLRDPESLVDYLRLYRNSSVFSLEPELEIEEEEEGPVFAQFSVDSRIWDQLIPEDRRTFISILDQAALAREKFEQDDLRILDLLDEAAGKLETLIVRYPCLDELSCKLGTLYGFQGTVLEEMGLYDKAVEAYEKASTAHEKAFACDRSSREDLPASLVSLAHCALKHGDDASAFHAIRFALYWIGQAIDDDRGEVLASEAETLMNLVRLNVFTGQGAQFVDRNLFEKLSLQVLARLAPDALDPGRMELLARDILESAAAEPFNRNGMGVFWLESALRLVRYLKYNRLLDDSQLYVQVLSGLVRARLGFVKSFIGEEHGLMVRNRDRKLPGRILDLLHHEIFQAQSELAILEGVDPRLMEQMGQELIGFSAELNRLTDYTLD